MIWRGLSSGRGGRLNVVAWVGGVLEVSLSGKGGFGGASVRRKENFGG